MEYNQDFKFYITTKLSNPHYTPEIATKTTIVNFAVKEQGLQAQLLGIVVRKERPELEKQKDKLVLSIASSKKNLADLEDRILHLLSTSQGSILDDEALVNALQSSKRTSEEVTEQLEVAEQTEVKIDGAREVKLCDSYVHYLHCEFTGLYMYQALYMYMYVSLYLHTSS